MSFFDYIYPKFCLGCGKFGTYCCSQCRQNIPKLQYLKCPMCGHPSVDGYTHVRCKSRFGMDGLLSIYPYTGVVQRAIKQMKYRFAFRVLGDVLHEANLDRLMIWKKRIGTSRLAIIPIPLYRLRQNFRGFNQSEIIARYIGKQLDGAVENGLLFRTKETLPQVEMKNKNERLHNMNNVFAVPNTHCLTGYAVVLLIDDVFTTGATMRSAASVLKRKGIPTVWGLTIAQ